MCLVISRHRGQSFDLVGPDGQRICVTCSESRKPVKISIDGGRPVQLPQDIAMTCGHVVQLRQGRPNQFGAARFVINADQSVNIVRDDVRARRG